jgi:hypothetical protein
MPGATTRLLRTAFLSPERAICRRAGKAGARWCVLVEAQPNEQAIKLFKPGIRCRVLTLKSRDVATSVAMSPSVIGPMRPPRFVSDDLRCASCDRWANFALTAAAHM